ncbi:dihydroneopterin triphosphate 2'-epimerase [Reinekea blandensis]|uniref:Dihydroneopterin triphosphate 2'-epimerase n=1 Tax=Reinekea blandensis MED297 TaxID=314283 RepID=A4BK60_9GAMM|nr:dihydroneopterin triphosphate 2'-epimerase [Reinekea blandensis]EAR07489.1 D-erythro-7,8-dihydroneopterin aldolase [Reinekea sp. MED297] [Reinekea blandensis MED297]
MHTAIINIRNLRLRTYIGFNPEELQKQQDVVINAEIHYPADLAVETDSENNAVNYKVITKNMIQHVENGQFKLLERLAGDLLAIASDHPDIQYAKVCVDKPHALRFADSVSITLEEKRD